MQFTERQVRTLLAVAVVLVGLGLWAFVIRGADQPADPVLESKIPTGFVPSPSGEASTTVATVAEGPGDPARVLLPGFDEIALAVEPAGGGDLLEWCLLAALDAAQRGRGLMEVTDLQGYSGMAFVYDEDVTNGFYMRNTPTPLSIAWVDSEGQLVTALDMAPCADVEGCPTYHPEGPYRVAIEVFQGGLDDLGIEPGATIRVGGQCGPRDA